MLSGKNVFLRGTSADTLSAILKSDPPELLPTAAGISPALDRIVRRCLEKSSADRFQSARDLGFALLAITGTGSSSGAVPPLASSAKKTEIVRYLGLAAIALAALFLTYFAGKRTSAPTIAAQPAFQQLTFRRGTIHSARFTPDGQTIVYGASFDGQPKTRWGIGASETASFAQSWCNWPQEHQCGREAPEPGRHLDVWQ